MVLGNKNGEVVELGSDDNSAAAQVMVTLTAKKINKRGNSDAAGTSVIMPLSHDSFDSLTQHDMHGSAEIEAKRQQMAQQRFKKENKIARASTSCYCIVWTSKKCRWTCRWRRRRLGWPSSSKEVLGLGTPALNRSCGLV
jgi:hypothetical protein